nr:MAG TPA: hypothetical protein [Caudoviricetes sp.]
MGRGQFLANLYVLKIKYPRRLIGSYIFFDKGKNYIETDMTQVSL